MSDSTVRSGNEPSLGGNAEQTGQEPSLGGREAQQLRAALELAAMVQRGNSDLSRFIDEMRQSPLFYGTNRVEALINRQIFGDAPALLQIDPEKQIKHRVVLLTTEINEQVAKLVVTQLLFHDQEKPGENIILVIKSAGGEVYPGLAILDVMTDRIRCPIITIGTGLVAGFAVLPLIAGTKGKRYITPDCQIVRTPLYTRGDQAQLPVAVQETSRLRDLINGTILKYTLLPEEDLSIEGEHYISPKEALRLGCVDHILRAPAQQITE